MVRGLNFVPLWQRAHLPNWGVCSAADTALFVAIWHQKHIRVKLNSGLLTNEIEEANTLKGGNLFTAVSLTCQIEVFARQVRHACQGLPTPALGCIA